MRPAESVGFSRCSGAMSSAARIVFFAFQLATAPLPLLRRHLGPARRRRQAWPIGHSRFRTLRASRAAEPMRLRSWVNRILWGHPLITERYEPDCMTPAAASPEEMIALARSRGERRRGTSSTPCSKRLPAPIYIDRRRRLDHLLQPRLRRFRRAHADARPGPLVRDLETVQRGRRASSRTRTARWRSRSGRGARFAARSRSPSGRTGRGDVHALADPAPRRGRRSSPARSTS